MAFSTTLPFYIDQATTGVVWLSRTRVVAIEMSIVGTSYVAVLWLSNDGGHTFRVVGSKAFEGEGPLYLRSEVSIFADASENIYMGFWNNWTLGRHSFIKWEKLSGDNWNPIWARITKNQGVQYTTPFTLVDSTGRIWHIALRQTPHPTTGYANGHMIFSHGAAGPFTDDTWLKSEISDTAGTSSDFGTAAHWAGIAKAGSNAGRPMTFFIRVKSPGGLGAQELQNRIYNGSDWQSGYCPTKVLPSNTVQWDRVAVANLDNGDLVAVVSDVYGKNIQYATYTFATNTWSAWAAVFTNPGSPASIPYLQGPFVFTDGVNAIVAYITRDTSTNVWSVRSRRMVTFGTWNTEIVHDTFANHPYMLTFERSGLQGPGGGRVIGPWYGKILDRAALLYHRTGFGTGMHVLRLIDNNIAPFKPTAVSPKRGQVVTTLTPTVDWDFQDNNVDDTQSAYQVIVYRQSDGVQMYDSGKVTSGSTQATIPGGASLAYNVPYQWKVRTWDAADLAGPYSDLFLFKATHAPTGVMQIPGALDSSLDTDSPTVSWTYSHTEGVGQRAYRVIVTAQGDPTDVVYDSDWIFRTDLTHDIPAGYLVNGGLYSAHVELLNQEGAQGTTDTANFDITYTGPPQPTISGSFVEDGGYNRLLITAGVPTPTTLAADTIRVYRNEQGTDGFELIETDLPIPTKIIEDMESATNWQAGTGAPSPTTSTSHKQGSNSLNLGSNAGAATALFNYNNYAANGPAGGLPFDGYDKLFFWLYVASPKAAADKIEIRFGQDSSNYFYYEVVPNDLTANDWNALVLSLDDRKFVGNPDMESLDYIAIKVWVSSGSQAAGIANGNLKIDQLRLYKDNVEFIDYYVGNGRSYTYRVVTHNSDQNLESVPAEIPLSVAFRDDTPNPLNTFVTPKGNEDIQVGGFQQGGDTPSWEKESETTYYQPIGRNKPIAYKSDIQQKHSGSLSITFWDPRFDGAGLEAVRALEAIKDLYPLYLRTWWGDQIPVSIDGKVSTERIKGLGYKSTFNWTEIDA